MIREIKKRKKETKEKSNLYHHITNVQWEMKEKNRKHTYN